MGLDGVWMPPELGVGRSACAEVGVVQCAHRGLATVTECVGVG